MSHHRPLKARIRDALLEAFPDRDDMERVAGDADMRTRWLDLDQHRSSRASAIDALLDWAESRGELFNLLDAAIFRNETSGRLKDLAATIKRPLQQVGVELGEFEQVILKQVGFEDVADWIENLSRIRHAVCRVEPQPESRGKVGYGTGFLIAPDMVITAWHVARRFWGKDELAREVRLRFGYERRVESANGSAAASALPGQEYQLRGDWGLPHSEVEECDFALLRLDRRADLDVVDGRKREFLTLHAQPIGDFAEQFPLVILQHPGGDPLKLAMGTITEANPPFHVWYSVNTKGGSSGSPCLNQRLQVVGLHHFGTSIPGDPARDGGPAEGPVEPDRRSPRGIPGREIPPRAGKFYFETFRGEPEIAPDPGRAGMRQDELAVAAARATDRPSARRSRRYDPDVSLAHHLGFERLLAPGVATLRDSTMVSHP
jgi:hypothetical protein